MRDSTVRRLSRLHRLVFRATKGRIGARLVDNDMLLLTTRGAVTGEPHTVPLLFLRDADRLVVIASYGGRPDHPQWYRNLVAEPVVGVRLPRARTTVERTARTATADERRTWWPRIVEAYDGYETYQARTEREIPVVFLEP
ncbi:MAG: nitroreductase family deazaflavin-dependent oxidoreductase [Acidimicrobiia bacterium]|nr:nitroreductase family deazaflavin-dependent oxidoreductase [Acidimicrobiia bacterium]